MESCVQQLCAPSHAPRNAKWCTTPQPSKLLAHEHAVFHWRGVSGRLYFASWCSQRQASGRRNPRIMRGQPHVHASGHQCLVAKMHGRLTSGSRRLTFEGVRSLRETCKACERTPRLFRTPGLIANHLLIIGETSLQRAIRTWQKAPSALQNRSAGVNKHSPPGLDRP
jgi:hypothetical protein